MLIVIEGTDGCGKNTQAKMLCDHLNRNNIPARVISFPNYESPASAPVREMLAGAYGKDPMEVNPYAASIMFAADRFDYFNKDWKKDYDNGTVIICDRYVYSNYIYQGSKFRDYGDLVEYMNWLDDLEFDKMKLPRANRVIYLDMPEQISRSLREERGRQSDIHEDSSSYLNRCRNTGHLVAIKNRWDVINCFRDGKLLTKEEVHKVILKLF